MDRRVFLSRVLLSAGVLALSSGAAVALPGVAGRDRLAPSDPVENVWWGWRRRRWRRWHRWHRW